MRSIVSETYAKHPFRIGLVGEYQSGKSLLINCILQRSIATVGLGFDTTHTVVNYRYACNERVVYTNNDGMYRTLPICEFHCLDTAKDITTIDVYLAEAFLKDFILTDMPGLGANEADNHLAIQTLQELDFAILIASNNKALGAQTSSFKDIHYLKQYSIPYYFVLNCRDTDKWGCNESANLSIAEQDLSLLSFYPPVQYPMKEGGMNIINFMWRWYSICDENDELINRTEIRNSIAVYEIEPTLKQEVGLASNFELIDRIFDMENRGFLELMSEIKKLKNDLCPIGTIQLFAFKQIPEGWMECDGRGLDINEYPMLYEAIGFTFGQLDNHTFRIPNLRGRFVRGWASGGIIDEGRKFGSYQDDAVQNHTHEFIRGHSQTGNGGGHSHNFYTDYHNAGLGNKKSNWVYDGLTNSKSATKKSTCSVDDHYHSLPSMSVGKMQGDARSSEETRPKNCALIYCIRVTENPIPTQPSIDILVSSMKCAGKGVYERFVWLEDSFLLTSDIVQLDYPLLVEYRDDSYSRKAYQRVDKYTPIQIYGQGVYLVRLVCSDETNIDNQQSRVQLFKINTISIVGDFTDHWASSIPVERGADSLTYEAELDLLPGQYEFKFRANDNWVVELAGDENNLQSWLGDNLVIESDGRSMKLSLDLSTHPWYFHIEYLS